MNERPHDEKLEGDNCNAKGARGEPYGNKKGPSSFPVRPERNERSLKICRHHKTRRSGNIELGGAGRPTVTPSTKGKDQKTEGGEGETSSKKKA